MSIFVWIKPSSVEFVATGLGLKVQRGKAANTYFVESRDSLLDPTADIRRIPSDDIIEVTMRAELECQLLLGTYKYQTAGIDTEMYVKEVMFDGSVDQGFYKVRRKMPSPTHRHVRLRSSNLKNALSMIQMALSGAIAPDPEVTAEVMKAVG